MNKKALSLGMIVPLAAAGAVATAPAASAAGFTSYRHSRADLDLRATAVHGNWIRVVATLDTNDRSRSRGEWVVLILKNGKVIEREKTHRSFLRVVEYTYDRRGTDRFSAVAFNTRTHERAYDRDVVKWWENGSR